jgi:AhpD family alkylhydroperoxidase
MYGVGVSERTEKLTALQWQEPLSSMRLIYREPTEDNVALVKLIEYADAPAEVRAIYDDIMKTRGTDWINNFWKALANDPPQLRRMWESVKQVMAPGALDPLVKEMVYVAISATNGCEYCTYSHTAAARKKGMSDAMFMELMAVVGLANETNRLANGLRFPVDPQFLR